MTDQGALEAANRAAHRVARASIEEEKAWRVLRGADGVIPWKRKRWKEAVQELERAQREYEEATGKGGVDGSS